MEPFVRSKDKVAIVGFAPTTRDKAPWDDPSYEIWGLNEEYSIFPRKVGDVFEYKTWMKRYDRWMQIHPRFDFMRADNNNARNHPLWLANQSGTCMACKGTKLWSNFLNGGIREPCPFCKDGIYAPEPAREGLVIYMQDKYDDVPGSVKFPLKQIVTALMPQEMKETRRQNYFNSSPAMLVALAIAMGYKEIGLYGFEMGNDTEWHYQKANFEYWLGRAHGAGIKVVLPDESPILRCTLYGYDNLKIGYRQDLEIRGRFLDGRVKAAEIDLYHAEGIVKALDDLRKAGNFTAEAVEEAYQKAKLEHAKAQGMKNFKQGAAQETAMQIKMYDAYFDAEMNNTEVELVQLVNTDYKFE